MKIRFFVYLFFVLVTSCVRSQIQSKRRWVTTDELENHISPEDLREFLHIYEDNSTTVAPTRNGDTEYADPQPFTFPLLGHWPTLIESESNIYAVYTPSYIWELNKLPPVPRFVDCFGLGSISRSIMKFLNMKPDDARTVNTHFYFSSRLQPRRVQVYNDGQFGLEHVDFKPERKTVMIVHGFMSHSNASWVLDMTAAFLEWGDLNVIAVDWSGGGNTWKYWRAVANTRRVGEDITRFLRNVSETTGVRVKDFHFVGHSLGAHIASFASHLLGGVSRITGLDPAQPCFATSNDEERLDASDADFVDIIHTNGRLLKKIGFGMPDPMGHADFYPNGGLRQPGCVSNSRSIWARMISNTKIQQAICSHGRAYILFTESLINNNCSFRAYRWDMSYDGVNTSLKSTCDLKQSCAEMGIRAMGQDGAPRAKGAYIVVTSHKEPYCESENAIQSHLEELLTDLRKSEELTTTPRDSTASASAQEYADPDLIEDPAAKSEASTSWWSKAWLAIKTLLC